MVKDLKSESPKISQIYCNPLNFLVYLLYAPSNFFPLLNTNRAKQDKSVEQRSTKDPGAYYKHKKHNDTHIFNNLIDDNIKFSPSHRAQNQSH